MEYERIHKVQTGIISPSKLRMKLIGSHLQRKKDGSNSTSARTSPSKLNDSDFVKNSLLASEFEDEAIAVESMPKEENAGRVKIQHYAKVDTSNSNAIYPLRIMEDENLDYDSTSSFEFHKGGGDRAAGHHGVTRSSISQFRTIPSKWNDAEKWIMSKPNQYPPKKNALQNQTNMLPVSRVAPDYYTNNSYDNSKKVPFNRGAVDTKRVDFSGEAYGRTLSQTRDLKELVIADLPCTKSAVDDDSAGVSTVREVCMRDMGTEMTPVPSQEPSRTGTPVGSATPHRSPSSSIPSTPRRGDPAPTPLDNATDKKDLSEEDLKIKTRREIVALGVKLGKMNIAAWASKEEAEKNSINTEELARVENEKCAAAWEEVEKSKHTARYKREEIEIQAWESRQKMKLEAEIRRIEAQVEQMRAEAQAKMVKKMTMARKRSEEKRVMAEARKNRDAERTAAQTEYIRQTGRLPSSSHYMCCSWL